MVNSVCISHLRALRGPSFVTLIGFVMSIMCLSYVGSVRVIMKLNSLLPTRFSGLEPPRETERQRDRSGLTFIGDVTLRGYSFVYILFRNMWM